MLNIRETEILDIIKKRIECSSKEMALFYETVGSLNFIYYL